MGDDRRTRLVTVGTTLALLVAVIAFFSLDDDPDGAHASPYLERMNQSCTEEKERIGSLESEALSQSSGDLQQFASVLVIALAEWRHNLRDKSPPAPDAARVKALEASLVATLVEAARLSRLIRDDAAPAMIDAQARAVDQATVALDRTIDSAGLSACAEVEVSPTAATRP